MVVVVEDVQIRMMDVKSEVVVMDLKDPVANYPWLKHVGYEVMFVVVEVLEVQASMWILTVHEVVKEISFLEVEMVFFHCDVSHLRIQVWGFDFGDDLRAAALLPSHPHRCHTAPEKLVKKQASAKTYLQLAVPWSNERSLENKELNAIIGALFTLWRD
ncbi:hypothetical protein Tco_0853458 [Tanacetum coccineum]